MSAFNRKRQKKNAVEAAIRWVRDNCDISKNIKIGIGSGTTVAYGFKEVARFKNLDVVPTSNETKRALQKRGVKLVDLDSDGYIKVDIDGADEVDPNLNLIKGGGGCHLREKRVASQSEKFIVVVDESKLVEYLGQDHPVPLEVKQGKIDQLMERLKF